MSASFESGVLVRQAAWHGLGVVVSEAPTLDAAYELSGLNWSVYLDRLLRMVPGDGGGDLDEVDMFAITRDSDYSVLGFCQGRYEAWQNKQAFEWCEPFVDSGLYQVETAGALDGGKTCWILLRCGTREVTQGDKLNNYLLLTYGHDGRTPIRVLPTSVRVVCQNTLRAALRNCTDVKTVRHSSNMVWNMEQVQALYLENEARFDRQLDEFQKLLARPVTVNERTEFISAVFPMVDGHTERSENGIERKRSFMGEMAAGMAAGLQGFSGMEKTAYGLYQAASESIEHYLGGNKVKDRGLNILSGQGEKTDSRAWDIMQDLMAAPVGGYKASMSLN